MSFLDSLLSKSIDNIGKKYNKSITNRFVFGCYPEHKVSKKTMLQLKSVLKGRPRITVKKRLLPKAYIKKVDNAFQSGNIVWDTPKSIVDQYSKPYLDEIQSLGAAGEKAGKAVSELIKALEDGKVNR